MAAIPLKDMGRAVIVSNPNGGFYMKRASFVKGATPSHLTAYRDRFAEAARSCKGSGKDMKGMEAVNAVRGCIKSKLGK